MAEESSELDKSETATPFRLQRARQRGVLARGRDLGFVSALVAFAIIAQTQGSGLLALLTRGMRVSFLRTASMANNPRWVSQAAGELSQEVAAACLLPGLILMLMCAAVEVIQNRGVTVSMDPLRPDFTRLNPAAGLKRFFSIRMLKEALKSVLKFAVYATGAYLYLRSVVATLGSRARDGAQFGTLLIETGSKLLLLFILLAAILAIVDQLLARSDFAKQMRMSRREVTRETREREGEPRLKRRRRQILTEIVKQARAATDVKGADILITNPTHYAVAVRYRPDENDAPMIHARGRNFWAQRMRDAARREGITIIRNPTLARALYHEGRIGKPIGQAQFVAVADIYISMRRLARQQGNPK